VVEVVVDKTKPTPSITSVTYNNTTDTFTIVGTGFQDGVRDYTTLSYNFGGASRTFTAAEIAEESWTSTGGTLKLTGTAASNIEFNGSFAGNNAGLNDTLTFAAVYQTDAAGNKSDAVTSPAIQFNWTDGGSSTEFTGGSLADTINGGGGNDTIIGGTGADTLTGGTGADTFRFAAGDSGTISGTVFDVITDFAVGTGGDLLDLVGTPVVRADASGVVVEAVTVEVSDDVTASVTNGIITLGGVDKANVDTLAEWIDVARLLVTTSGNIAAFEFNGDTYVFQENGTDDLLVQLDGVVGITDFSSVAPASSTIFFG
jgi:hypothetical protein